MANEKHVALLKRDVDAWNAWRREKPDIQPDLFQADLFQAKLCRANLLHANLGAASLVGANLNEADLRRANLTAANLTAANLTGADLRWASLAGADLSGANLIEVKLFQALLPGANLTGADLSEANFDQAVLSETVLGNTNLTKARSLKTCWHGGPSILDHRTVERSGPLPLVFLRGVGLPDNIIEYLQSLPNQFYSCFISYSAKDQEFADHLYDDLQNRGVRCWFAPHDLPIGAKTWDTIDEAIQRRDKVLLILSENAIASDWVEDEVSKAFAEERDRKQTILFPIRLDDVVMQTEEAWARKLRDQRNIGSFIGWKDRDSYRKSLEQVLRDLIKPQPPKS